MNRLWSTAVAAAALLALWAFGAPVLGRLQAEAAGAKTTRITLGQPIPAEALGGAPAAAPPSRFPRGSAPAGGGTLTGHRAPVSALAFSPDGAWLLSMGGDLLPKYWATETRIEYPVPGAGEILLADVAFDPLGRAVHAVDNGGRLMTWELTAGLPGEPRALPSGGHTPRLAVSPNGRWLALSSWDRHVRVWETGARKLAAELVSDTPLRSLAFSSDGRTLAVGDGGNRLILWDLATGVRRAWRVPKVAATADCSAVAFSPDGRSLAAGFMDSSIVVWDVRAGRDRLNFFVRDASTWDVAISPAGDLLATASQDGHIRLWNLATGERRFDLAAHTGGARTVAFSPDGRWLASGGDDGTIQLWQ